MEIHVDNLPNCALKCLRNIEDVSHSIHRLKYGVNTIGRGLNNDIVLKNLNVSRTHCHLRVEKKDSKDIAYIKDLGTSNGTIIGNINLIELEEHQLNDLDMIILANGDEGVVLQFIDQIERTIGILNNNKRKVPSVEILDEPTTVKIPKLEKERENRQSLLTFQCSNDPSLFKEPLSYANIDLSNKSKNTSNIINSLQSVNLSQSTSIGIDLKSVQSGIQSLSANNPYIPINNTESSCSHNINDAFACVKIKIEPNINNMLSQGTYRNEEDSVIVIYSSDEENDLNENDLILPTIKIKQEDNNLYTSSIQSVCPIPSTIQSGKNLNVPDWSIHCQNNEIIISDDDDDDIYIPPNLSSNNNLLCPNDDDSNSKCLQIIEPLPMKPITRSCQTQKTCFLTENKNKVKTHTKPNKKIINKKKTDEITVNQNKQIIQERRLRLQQLTKNKCSLLSNEDKTLNKNLSSDEDINKPSTTDNYKKKIRISRLQQQNHTCLCVPSTSKSCPDLNDTNNILSIKQKVVLNNQDKTLNSDNYNSSLNCNNLGSLSSKNINLLHFAYFDTLSKICKWNALWLREEKFCDQSPPLVTNINKMKTKFKNPLEYSSIVKPLMLHEIWSKISESYNLILSKNPNLEKYIFEKSLKKNTPLMSFNIQSVNKEFSLSVNGLKGISTPLWCLKCVETEKSKTDNSSGQRFLFRGFLCLVIIQSESFETDTERVKKPNKSRNIFFAYVNSVKKNGFQSNSFMYIELIITNKTENIPIGTLIHLKDIFYLHSELRLFQAIENVNTCSLSKALITPQCHSYTIDYSKVNIKNYNINNLILNNSQKEAVRMAIKIVSSKEPNLGLIIGPPGTGKTSVICSIILNLMFKQQNNMKPKCLICAPSNEAVDALVRRILEIKKNLKHELQLNIVRVGNGQKYDPNSPISDVLLDNLVRKKMINFTSETDQDDHLNNLPEFTDKRDIEKDILLSADVVMTTLNSCFSKNMENVFRPSNMKKTNDCHFTACIVDEAGQCIEPLNFVPILLNIDKLILVGDDKQLQPLIKSKTAKDNGLGISLFKRLKTWFEHSRKITKQIFPITVLNIQYRMHHEICLFPSNYFYKGVVNTAPSVRTRKQLPFLPYIILEHESQDNSSEINIGEANLIVNLVEVLLKSDCKTLTIAVLTPYHKQREQINMLLRNKKISLNVNTIDSFQGGECDILLISTVRTTGIGFMDDICRLNVALTRAKQSLIICGNFMSLKVEQIWHDLLEDAKKRKLFKKVSNNVISNSRTLLAMIKH